MYPPTPHCDGKSAQFPQTKRLRRPPFLKRVRKWLNMQGLHVCARRYWSKRRLSFIQGDEPEGFDLRDGAVRGKLKEGRDTVEFNKHMVNGSKETKDKREQGPTAEGAPKCPKEQRDFVLAKFALTEISTAKKLSRSCHPGSLDDARC
jgi:hypothetical protein